MENSTKLFKLFARLQRPQRREGHVEVTNNQQKLLRLAIVNRDILNL